VEVEAPNNVFWRELVFQRQNKPNAKQVVMHLINLSGPPKTTMILGRHAIPQPLRDIPASIRWEPKASPQVTVVFADGDQSPRRVPVSRADETIHFTIPSLDHWTTVVVSTTRVDQLGSNKVKTK